MALIKQSAVVPYTPEQMYDLVNGIDKYPEFLPWCKTSEIHLKTEDEVKASLTLAKGSLEKSFTTVNRLQKNKMIEVRLVSGPFRHLEGFWTFETIGDNLCRVSLDLEFELANTLISFAIGPLFHQMANTLVDAFCNRAKEVYG
jgi:ribosome-associated toxin RatA of RatAB toxin-antitoxin module